ncbi:MAG: LVIVD repeat-containing protein [Longimicrobiales bacterium]
MGRPGDALGPGERGTSNIQMLSHVPLGGFLHVADVEIEQEESRPFVYVSRRFDPTGFDVISVADPDNAEVIYRWRIENSALHQGSGALDGRYFKHKGRYYYVQSTQFGQGGPDADLGAIVFDVTGLPDASTVREVGRIREPGVPGGFHNIYMYKHSDGRPLLFTTTRSEFAYVYDMGRFVEGDQDGALVARIANPETAYWALSGGTGSWHDFYVGYDLATGQDRFWGGGRGGYFVFDISDLQSPELLVSITGVAGVNNGHTFTPSPDGRFAVGETEYQYAPLRIYDVGSAMDAGGATIRRPISAWTANWQNLSHNHEVRWPFVFVAAYEDGFQVFNMFDPFRPITWGFYDTYGGPHESRGENNVNTGGWGVDVRNSDGLIVLSDMVTGLWVFRMEGFEGWNGLDWGMPNISSVQDWERGPAVQAVSR